MTEPVFFGDDADLAAAVDQARSTFKLFWREMSWEYRRVVPAFGLACVKVAFEEDGVVEHMWVSEVEFDGDTLAGMLLNEPNQIASLHEGDTVGADFGPRVSDWMLANDKQVLGAHTVHAMRKKMRPEERAAHDAAWGLPFGDPESVALPPSGGDHPMALSMLPALEKFLKENPGELTALDENGLGMLHREALAGNSCVVAALLAHGAQVNARTEAGKTPLTLARTLGWPRVEATLAQAGGTD